MAADPGEQPFCLGLRVHLRQDHLPNHIPQVQAVGQIGCILRCETGRRQLLTIRGIQGKPSLQAFLFLS
jgi:hypothetical protein